jgi:hypothetical protein
MSAPVGDSASEATHVIPADNLYLVDLVAHAEQLFQLL